jgi:hypothetical protein
VAADIRTTDFVKKIIKSGESVERKPGGRNAHAHGRVAEEAAARARARG